MATNGRYGPYLKRGSESRSLQSEDQLFTVGLEEALALFAQPRTMRGRAAAPLRELGPDPTSGAPIVLREGRFGPYVTDGSTNASLRKGDTIAGITPDRAVELLAERRAAGPGPDRRKKADAKKAAAPKKAGVKKAAPKKAGVKKAGAKKAGAKKAAAPKKAGVKKAAASKTAAAAIKGAANTGAATKKAAATKAAVATKAGGATEAGGSSQAPAPQARKRSEA